MIQLVDPARFAAFLGVMAAMAAAPGPANLFAVATGAQRGRAAALLGMVGMNCATLVWFGAAALGLGALVLAWPQAFSWMVYVGAAYLAWLAFKAFKQAWRPEADAPAAAEVHRDRSAFRDGFAVQIANPKVVLFFTAVLPPFLDPTRPMPPQIGVFAAVTISADALAMSLYGLGGAALAVRMSQPRFRRVFQIFVGVLLFTAAALMILRR